MGESTILIAEDNVVKQDIDFSWEAGI